MREPHVLVLTPSGGGHFYGALVAGVGREVALAGGRVLLVLTADPSLAWVDPTQRLDSVLPLGWDRADAAVVLMGAVSEGYVERLEAAGVPVVTIGERPATVQVPTVLPDNVRGIHAAVDDLVGHGHTRIGFVGHMDVPDIVERYEAYLERMDHHGLAEGTSLTPVRQSNTPRGLAVG
ncbi:MAG TPA: substrate-binding domain-containing protein, partial [Actinotalea sp.]|nr:substrate-binding domain-containing protein [Actinotalea sp.]